MVREIHGDLLKQPIDIIAHHINYMGRMDEGLALQIKKQLLTSDEYHKYTNFCKDQGEDALGNTLLIEAPDGRIIANCFGKQIPQKGAKLSDYDAFLHSMAKVRNYARIDGLKVGVPGLIGCGYAGGDWKIVRDMLYKLFGAEDQPELVICYLDEKEFLKWNPNK